jgi:hypothetical protein
MLSAAKQLRPHTAAYPCQRQLLQALQVCACQQVLPAWVLVALLVRRQAPCPQLLLARLALPQLPWLPAESGGASAGQEPQPTGRQTQRQAIVPQISELKLLCCVLPGSACCMLLASLFELYFRHTPSAHNSP